MKNSLEFVLLISSAITWPTLCFEGRSSTLSEYAGRIAVGAILAIALVVGLAFELNYLVPSNAAGSSSTAIGASGTSTLTSSTSATGWFGNEVPPTYCGNMTKAAYTLGNGYTMNLYLASTLRGASGFLLGSNICFYTYLQNLDNKSTSLPSSENIVVTSFRNQSRNSGMTIYENSCPVPVSYSEPFGPNSTGWNCSVVWNTSQPYNGILPSTASPDNYVVNATVPLSGSPEVIHAPPFSFSFTTSPFTATTSSTTTPEYSCGGQAFKLLTPLQSGPILLKAVTGQGSIINNGSVFVTHVGPNGTANYCLRLQPNADGYLQLAADDGLPQTGSYNLTLIAGYNQGSGYEGSIPSFTVQSNTTVDVTISVPSGEVYVATSTQGSNLVSTTTTTATSIESDG